MSLVDKKVSKRILIEMHVEKRIATMKGIRLLLKEGTHEDILAILKLADISNIRNRPICYETNYLLHHVNRRWVVHEARLLRALMEKGYEPA
jgi:hypothetical protein